MIRALVAATAATTVLLVSGCSGSSSDDDEPSARDSDNPTSATTDTPSADDSETETDAPAASGDEISGSAYSYQAPEGWGEPSQKVPGFDPDSLAANLQDEDDFADNINVIKSPAGELTAEAAEKAAVTELEGAGAKDVTVEDRVEVAGAETAHVSALFSVGDKSYQIEQYYPTDGGQTWVTTFSFSTTVTPDQRAEVTGPVMASWTWDD